MRSVPEPLSSTPQPFSYSTKEVSNMAAKKKAKKTTKKTAKKKTAKKGKKR